MRRRPGRSRASRARVVRRRSCDRAWRTTRPNWVKMAKRRRFGRARRYCSSRAVALRISSRLRVRTWRRSQAALAPNLSDGWTPAASSFLRTWLTCSIGAGLAALPDEQRVPVGRPVVGDDREVLDAGAVAEQHALGRADPDRQVTVDRRVLLLGLATRDVRDLGPLADDAVRFLAADGPRSVRQGDDLALERLAHVGADREPPAAGVPVVERLPLVGGAVRAHADLPGVLASGQAASVWQGGVGLVDQLLDPLAGRHVAVAKLVGQPPGRSRPSSPAAADTPETPRTSAARSASTPPPDGRRPSQVGQAASPLAPAGPPRSRSARCARPPPAARPARRSRPG